MSGESMGRTLLVATGVALFCSLMVSAAVIYLRPVQMAWEEIGRNRVILLLAGRAGEAGELSDREVALRFGEMEVLLIELAEGRPDQAGDPLRYDARDPATLAKDGVDIPEDMDLAELGRRARLAPVYLDLDHGAVQRLILPLWGQGMWAPINGFLAFEPDCQTVAGIAIFEHGETPGIGDRISGREWQASWAGLQAFGPDGAMLLAPKGSGRPAASQSEAQRFDAISGATVTVNAVSSMVQYWLGDHGFGPFLANCRAGKVRLS